MLLKSKCRFNIEHSHHFVNQEWLENCGYYVQGHLNGDGAYWATKWTSYRPVYSQQVLSGKEKISSWVSSPIVASCLLESEQFIAIYKDDNVLKARLLEHVVVDSTVYPFYLKEGDMHALVAQINQANIEAPKRMSFKSIAEKIAPLV